MAIKDCLDIVKSSFKGKRGLKDSEAKFILEEIERRSKTGGFFGGPMDALDPRWQEIAKAVVDDVKQAAYIERRNHKLNIIAKDKLLKLAREAGEKYGDPSIGIEAALIGTNKHLRGGSVSVGGIQDALIARYMNGMVGDLERAPGGSLLAVMRTGEMDREIANALEKLTKPSAKGSSVANANKIAAIIHKWRKVAFDARNRVGSWAKPLDGYITRQTHDPAKVSLTKFDEWKKFIRDKLDPRTFDGVDDVDEFLHEAYNSIVSNSRKANVSDIDVKFAFEGPGNLAKRVSERHRVLHFKDANNWFDYNEKFGFNTVGESVFAEFRTMAEDTGLMQRFGTNPEAMMNNVLDQLKTEFRGDLKIAKKLSSNNFKRWMTTVDGSYRNPGSVTWAKRGQFARGLQNWSKLSMATVSSITDIPMQAAQIRYLEGGGLLSPLAKSVNNFFKGMSRERRFQVALKAGIGIDGINGSIAARLGVEDDIGGITTKLNTLYFKLNLLTPWTDANKAGMGMYVSNYLADNASKSFDQLPSHLKGILNDFDIDAARWSILRKTVEKVEDGTSYMFPEKLRDMEDAVFAGAGIDPRLVGAERDNIDVAFRSLLNDFVERGVPTPGARERAALIRGFQPGTIEGEAARFIAQFKSFPLTVVNKSLGRLWNGHNGKADLVGLSMLIAQTTILGYVAMSLKDILKGKEPRWPDTPGEVATVMTAAMLQGGALGLYGDFLFAETDRYGKSIIEDIAGPGIGTGADIFKLLHKIKSSSAAGEPGEAGAMAFRLAIQNMPSVLVTRQVLDYMVIYHIQEMLNPGYIDRMERRMEKDKGQKYLLPPSKFAN